MASVTSWPVDAKRKVSIPTLGSSVRFNYLSVTIQSIDGDGNICMGIKLNSSILKTLKSIRFQKCIVFFDLGYNSYKHIKKQISS